MCARRSASSIAALRPPVDHIAAPAFPLRLPWMNTEPLRIDQQRGRPLLIEFWDFCRPNSIRTLPYVKAWHERYGGAGGRLGVGGGLRVIGVHTPGFAPSEDPEAVRAAVTRLEVRHPVVVDIEHEIWRLYGNLGWPARYLFDAHGLLTYFHYGEGSYRETECAIQELLGLERGTVPALRPEDAQDARLGVPTEDVSGPYRGPYEAGGVWAVLDGRGHVSANGHSFAVEHPGCYELVCHARSTRGQLELDLSDGVHCHAVCFTPGLAR